MTREEFTKGWALLTIQPWGRYYDGREEPEKAQLQFELYYAHLSFAHPDAWKDTALAFAAGASWPTLTELQQSLSRRNKAYRKELPAPDQSEELSPEEQQKCEETLSRLIGKPFKIH